MNGQGIRYEGRNSRKYHVFILRRRNKGHEGLGQHYDDTERQDNIRVEEDEEEEDGWTRPRRRR